MNNPSTLPPENASREQMMSGLFANMVIQQTNMALVFLGKVPHPQTGQVIRELDAAQMFIDQLEMLAVKTRGNLGKEEERLLQQSLMMLRMEFVEAVEHKDAPLSATLPAATATAPPSGGETTPATPSPAAAPETAASTPTPETDESRKRFTKKY